MYLSSKQLIGLPVYTKNGQFIGKIAGFEVDPQNHAIVKYQVKTKHLTKQLVKECLLISSGQVLSITSEKMIVEEALPGVPGLIGQGALS